MTSHFEIARRREHATFALIGLRKHSIAQIHHETGENADEQVCSCIVFIEGES